MKSLLEAHYRGLGAWPYAGLNLLKVEPQMMQTLHTSANILHVCIHKNMLKMFQQKLHFLIKMNKLTLSVI